MQGSENVVQQPRSYVVLDDMDVFIRCRMVNGIDMESLQDASQSFRVDYGTKNRDQIDIEFASKDIRAKLFLDLEQVVFIGNDLNDFEVMSIVGYPVAPADAHPKIRNLAAYVTSAKGGEGVIKEFAEWIMAGYND